MKISIITPSLNCENLIQKTLNSVNEQRNIETEHIIIDGKSEDGTLEVLSEYKNEYDHITVLSEEDKGLYDGMNKGIQLATGDIIGILNAGDFYANPNVLEQVASVFHNNDIDSVYGDLVYVKEDNKDKIVRFWKSRELNRSKFYKGWMPPHPTFFVRKSVYCKYGLFNTDLKISADYELVLRLLLKHKVSSFYIPEVLVYMPVGGVSNANFTNRLKANREDKIAWQLNGLKPKYYTIIWKPISKLKQFFIRK